ncbi:MAG: hypothetical protein NTX28_12970 [Novosphingobium sp.]|nr:hypothetical protein [Novosphingobium sp.]
MSAHSALSSPPPAQGKASKRHDRVAPRLASGEERPVQSPVHALQQELIRTDAVMRDSSGSSVQKAPGWVRLTLPLAASLALWAVIFQLVSMVW